MGTLKRILYIQAGVWAAAGLAIALVPRFILVTVFDQPALNEYAWARMVGVEAIGLAMLMVLVAHRIEEMWWWAWAFAFATTATAGVVVLNAAFGLAPGESAPFWWIFGAVTVGFGFALLYGLGRASLERPPD